MKSNTARIAIAAAVAAATLAAAAPAGAHPTAAFLARTTIRAHSEYVLGHKVRVCSWRPGDAHVRGIVRYSRSRPRMLEGWAQAGRRRARSVCAMNGGTYRTQAPNMYRPSGTVFAGGVRITRVSDAPAVGFLAHGQVAFGARTARRLGSKNVMNGLAYLVRKGVPLRSHADAPWTTSAQYACGPRGSDSWYGCSRSVLARFKNGRVGLVEIALVSMPTAARVLMQMGARTAITFDSGGGARMWTISGRHNAGRGKYGHVFGTIPAGYPWHRLIPDAIVVNAPR